MSDALRRPLPPSVFARLADAARYVITGVSPDTWFGPLQPLQPMAPPEVKGRQWDYSFGANLNYIPRADDSVSFGELRGLADALPLLRSVIETRKDQIAAQSYAIRPRDRKDSTATAQAIEAVTCFLARPDRRHSFAAWLRMLLEDMLVIDAATLYPRYDRGGSLYSLDVIDGATIKPLIGEDGRAPEPPDPAYQQILKGIPAADFSVEELLYLPRNVRAHRLYGMSPVEQIALTVNIALRREAATLDYYRAGSTPDAFATLPKEWTADQIRSFQDYFDALMSGNLARRRQTKFMPADFKLIEARQPPLKDQYDEWLARLICYAFSVPVSAFVSQVNRATGETLRQQAAQEGLVPLKAWVKNALDHAICVCMNEPSLEFVWVGDDAVDPLEQAQTLQILVSAGIKTREEARADLGLAPEGGALGKPSAGLGKYNSHHDERGLFATADNAAGPIGSPTRKPRPTGVQVASNNAVGSDAGRTDVAQVIEPEPPPIIQPESRPPERPPAPPEAQAPRSEESAPATPTEFSLEDLVNGKFPGVATRPGTPRTMPASDDPASAAQSFIRQLTTGRDFVPVATDLDTQGGYVFQLDDGTYITYRPPGISSEKTNSTTASVDIDGPKINAMNGGKRLKLKFPKK
jgi:Phage portal protein